MIETFQIVFGLRNDAASLKLFVSCSISLNKWHLVHESERLVVKLINCMINGVMAGDDDAVNKLLECWALRFKLLVELLSTRHLLPLTSDALRGLQTCWIALN